MGKRWGLLVHGSDSLAHCAEDLDDSGAAQLVALQLHKVDQVLLAEVQQEVRLLFAAPGTAEGGRPTRGIPDHRADIVFWD